MSYYTATFLAGSHRFGIPFPKLQTFSEILYALHIEYEKTIQEISVYLHIFKVARTKVNFYF